MKQNQTQRKAIFHLKYK